MFYSQAVIHLASRKMFYAKQIFGFYSSPSNPIIMILVTLSTSFRPRNPM